MSILPITSLITIQTWKGKGETTYAATKYHWDAGCMTTVMAIDEHDVMRCEMKHVMSLERKQGKKCRWEA